MHQQKNTVMSVTTTADTERDNAKDSMNEAIKHINSAKDSLTKALSRDTWGSDEYTSEYTGKMETAELELAEIAVRVNRLVRKL